ncbi:MAG: glycosyltransferase [Lachnospiraceae bacterium]|nr:glycosyltransferase [Lachnospiraceae bacterium]
MIKTSVIIPVYNTSSFLKECIDSAFNQTQKDIEVIAIDDGSTDDSRDVLLCLQKKYPELIIITQENHGQGYARNVGIKRAKGEYIYFLDSDDYIMEDTLECCYEYASKNKLDLALFDALLFENSIERKLIETNNCDRHEIIEEREEIFSGNFFLQKYYRKSYIPTPWSMYCSATFLKKNGIEFLTGVYFEDNEFYCKAMILAERVMYIPKMFYRYRCREDSTTGSAFNLKKASDHIEVISAMADLKTLYEGKGWHIVKEISLNLLLYVAKVCYDNDLYDKDAELYTRILSVWMKLCGNTIEKTDDLQSINCIYSICYFFPDSYFGEIKNQVEIKRRQLLIQMLEQSPLNQKGIKTAIYGSGKYTEALLDFYEKWVGVIKADVIFLDSYVVNCNTKYRGYSVYSINEVQDKSFDYILISSPQYEEEMCDIIRKLYGNQFATIMLYGDLHIYI